MSADSRSDTAKSSSEDDVACLKKNVSSEEYEASWSQSWEEVINNIKLNDSLLVRHLSTLAV